MKTLLIIGILLISFGGQAFSMGHPHNMFAARKQMRVKASTSVAKNKPTTSVGWQHSVQETKAAVRDRLLAAFAFVRPMRAY